MPSRKTIVVFIFSITIVTSVWIFSREKSGLVGDVSAVANEPRPEVNVDYDWKSLLVANPDNSFETVVTTDSDNVPTDTTTTSLLSKDLLSQYLLAVKQSGKITDSDITRITSNIISVPEYTTTAGAVYVSQNLNLVDQNDKSAFIIYRNRVNELLRNSSSRIEENPIDIVISAIENEDENTLKKLDTMITIARNLIKDLLSVETPSSAVSEHLKLVNTFSKILAGLEAMRVSIDDPIRGVSGITYYNQVASTELTSALQSMYTLFNKKTGSAY